MARVVILAYGILAYLVFVISLVWAVLAIAGFGIERSLDAPASWAPLPAAMLDCALLALFAAQHSVMARSWFKRALTPVVPEAAERSTYVLLASLILIALFVFWQPIGPLLWAADGHTAIIIFAIYALGWLLVVVSTFQFSHFELFGIKQVLAQWTLAIPPSMEFKTPPLYRLVRHPMMLGLIIAFWAAPRMTAGHVLFAVLATAYIVVGVTFEERDLVQLLGDAYSDYRRRVPMLIPRVRR